MWLKPYSYKRKRLVYWLEKNKFKKVQKCLKNGADPNQVVLVKREELKSSPTTHRMVLIEWLVHNSQFKFIKLLVKYGANMHRTIYHRSLIYYLSRSCYEYKKRISSIKILLDLGYDPDRENRQGEPLIMFASENNYIELIKLLIEYKCDINKRGTNRKTALMYACETVPYSYENPSYEKKFHKENIKTIQLLLDNGADPNLTKNILLCILRVLKRKNMLWKC